ncbi:MAG: DMT family transporter [Thermodesulfovibrionales bacterium]
MNNLWIYLTLLSAFSLAVSDVFTKKVVNAGNEFLVAWLRLLFCLPLLLAGLFFIDMPALDRHFYASFVIAIPLEIVAVILYVKALRLSPLSLTLPFLSLTPLFLIIFSYVILREPVTLRGGSGIVLIAAGGYMLNVHILDKGVLEPFKAVLRERGSVYMIIVAFIYSFTSSLSKVAIVHSSPLFFGSTYFIAVTLLLAPVSLRFSGGNLRGMKDRKAWIIVALSGIAYSIMIITHVFAIKTANVAYMIAVKRTSLLIGVLFGYLFFHERKPGQRFTGALLMFAGFALIVTSA